MSELTATRFSCDACGRSYTWKQEIAGRRAKCTCGHLMTIPASPHIHEQEHVYDLAPGESEPSPVTPQAPRAPRLPLAPMRKAQTSPPVADSYAVHPTASPAPARAQTLAYQGGPTKKQIDRLSSDTLIDMKRDVYVPASLLVVGMLAYLGYYQTFFGLGKSGIVVMSVGLAITTVMKAALLMGFAFIVAGWVGVSFGGVWTAALKLAATAIFCDGACLWASVVANHFLGGFGSGFLFIIAYTLLIYWSLFSYLFRMDAGESWLVVCLLAAFSLILQIALTVFIVGMIMSWGGAIVPSAASKASVSPTAAAMIQEVNDLKDSNQLEEARQFIAKGHQAALKPTVDQWYEAGCGNVWFEVSRDFNGKPTPDGLIVEMPKSKDSRANCYQILKAYYDAVQLTYGPKEVADSEQADPYLFVRIR